MHVVFCWSCGVQNASNFNCLSSKGEFIRKVTVIKERMQSREQEVNGRWLTEDRMRRVGEWSASAIKSMVAYCKRFPDTLVRTWGGFWDQRTS